ncbi:MAG: BadF/BadG/BcrA/BcrD ATPase family protein [Desulfitobacteriaceae bacterium]
MKRHTREYEPEETVVTGYGRVSFPESRVVTEITCQAKGCHYFYPEIPFILDLGGQDAKVIKKNANGKVVSFVMNDKCAAGTGRFLDVIFNLKSVSS